MNLSRLTLSAILMCWITVVFSQEYPVFIMVDEIAEELDQLKSEYNGQPHVYFINGFSPNAIEQFATAAENLHIGDLHIYAATKPGAIVFNSLAITPGSLPEVSPALKEWSRVVSNKVVIHSEVVFTEDEGILLKQRLEEITGLVFTTQN
jgi:hypothetical protein